MSLTLRIVLIKEKVANLDKELDRIESRTDAIEKRMQDMSSSSIMMNRLLLSTQEAIEELRFVLIPIHCSVFYD